ncbi:hypothetical protein BG003_010601 [Podila horticola]|nr:hypothetical protein BG003_010601 [Podila horticola]
MDFLDIARYFNLVSYVTFLISDIVLIMGSVQDDKFYARFYHDYLAIILIATYAVSDLSRTAHVCLSLFTFAAGFWCTVVVIDFLYDALFLRRSPSFEASYRYAESGSFIICMTWSSQMVVNGETMLTHRQTWMDISFRLILRRLNVGFGLVLLAMAFVELRRRLITED